MVGTLSTFTLTQIHWVHVDSPGALSKMLEVMLVFLTFLLTTTIDTVVISVFLKVSFSVYIATLALYLLTVMPRIVPKTCLHIGYSGVNLLIWISAMRDSERVVVQTWTAHF